MATTTMENVEGEKISVIDSTKEKIKEKIKEIKNTPLYKDILSHPMSGCYEHKDETGNWVEGPALGHCNSGGFDEYSKNHKTKLDSWLENMGIIKD